MKIAIIPARGGSKRIPKKNIKDFCGKPMIVWAIEKAIKSNCFDEIIVTTDDTEIMETANEHGAKTPFKRSKKLSDDHTITVPVIANALLECEALGWNIDYACCIYPCSPFIETEDLKLSFEKMIAGNYKFIYPITEYKHPIQRSIKFNKNNMVEFKFPEYELTRTQDLEKLYHDTGQFYWGTRGAWIENGRMHIDGTAYVIPSWRVVDIDNEDDWIRAELMHKTINQRY
jgi:pseudaminic acid cytidylyltransferase